MNLLYAGVMADKLHLRPFLNAIGIVELSKKIYYKKQMKESQQFYSTKEDEIKRVLDSFSDDYSRDVYRKCIDYRCCFRKKVQPPFGPGEQYFPECVLDALEKTKKEHCFVDCGAFIGDTIEVFRKYVKDSYETAIGFEPDDVNSSQLLLNHKDDDRVKCIKAGVWDRSTVLSFEAGEGGSSKVIEGTSEKENVVSIDVCAIDSVPECQNASFIKMDIEGSEMHALNGAKGVIEKNRPILAICIYHSDEDMISIPLWIIDHCIDYDFYCRHYSVDIVETVFYAIPKP